MFRKNAAVRIKKIAVGICLTAALFSGCASVPVSATPDAPSYHNSQEPAAVLTIGERSVKETEALVYIYLMQKPYEDYYGSELWKQQREDGKTWETWLLEEVQRQMTEIEILSLKAEQAGMHIDTEQKTEVDANADAVFETMQPAAEQYGITRELFREIYERSQLAGMYYQSVMESYTDTLTEKEQQACSGMTVQQIFIAEDDEAHLESGQTPEKLAAALRERAVGGEDFKTLAKAYSSDNAQWVLSMNREGYVFDTEGWLEDDFVKAAWKLQEKDISPVIHTTYGYHILKCVEMNSEALRGQDAAYRLKDKKQQHFLKDYSGWQEEIACSEEAAWRNLHVLRVKEEADS